MSFDSDNRMSDSSSTTLQWNFKVGAIPSEDAQAAAELFLSFSKERVEAIRSLVKLPPDVIASVLLAHIPVEDAMSLEKTNKTLQAMEYVKGGIQHRAKDQGVYFCNGKIRLPEDIVIHVLWFLDKRDLIDGVSHVSNAWAKASISPHVRRWQTIDYFKAPQLWIISDHQEVEIPYSSEIKTREELLQMIQRPQFSCLQKLVVPMELTDSLLEEIAEASPTLEEFETKRPPYKLSGEMMRKLPVLFPVLKKVSVLEMRNTKDVIGLVEAMGGRLVELIVEVHVDMEEAGFTDDDFIFIARHCPNLRSFTYSSVRGYIRRGNMQRLEGHLRHSQMTERGLAAIVEGCPWLENLSLAGTCNFIFTPECFPILAFKARNLRFLNVLGPHFDA
jgi:hypothetical protein